MANEHTCPVYSPQKPGQKGPGGGGILDGTSLKHFSTLKKMSVGRGRPAGTKSLEFKIAKFYIKNARTQSS